MDSTHRFPTRYAAFGIAALALFVAEDVGATATLCRGPGAALDPDAAD